jgi:uncharacterized protein
MKHNWIFKMENKFYEELKKHVKTTLGEKGSHDFNHTERVYNHAIAISKGLNVDLDVVKASALLHDIVKHKEKKGEVKDHATQGAIEARKILENMNFPKEKIDIVCKCILLHNKKPDFSETKEIRILQEADGLEAVGAIGIARDFSYIGEENVWNNSSPKNPINELIRNSNSGYFTFPIAKKLAEEKIKITKLFCNQFIKEIELTN